MATATLQQLMVINKGSSLPLLIKAKSFVLDIVTWALWAYIITFVARYAERIFTKPILESFFFVDVIGTKENDTADQHVSDRYCNFGVWNHDEHQDEARCLSDYFDALCGGTDLGI